ncbi:MAG: hypothetical protein ACP5TJ_01430 [Candidatus Micrarchaeia archaeon]
MFGHKEKKAPVQSQPIERKAEAIEELSDPKAIKDYLTSGATIVIYKNSSSSEVRIINVKSFSVRNDLIPEVEKLLAENGFAKSPMTASNVEMYSKQEKRQ